MLALDDPRWAELSSPGGPVAELLTALRTVRNSPADAKYAIEVVAGYACHQYSVYGTTVAVVPYLVRAASELPPAHRNRYELLSDAGVFTLLVGDRPERLCPRLLGPTLGEAFVAAVGVAGPLAGESLLEAWPEDQFAYLLAALAAFRGHRRVGGLLSRSPREVWCPGCNAEFHPLEVWGRPDA